jgi:hypothetical protein
MKYFITISLLMGWIFAQNPSGSNVLDGNDMTVMVHSAGDLGWDLVASPQFEVPAGSGRHALFASSLWLGAVDAGDQLMMTSQTYRQDHIEYSPGPIANRYSNGYDRRYDRVYKVTAAEVTTHRAQWNQPGYQAPADLAEWPAHGDTTNGEPWLLAPFVDHNGDGVYRPGDGDYPLFYGEQALYSVFNDQRAMRNGSVQGMPLGVDIHSLAYVYSAPPGDPLDQTMFITYKIVNRSTQTLFDMHMAQWTDFDLGFFRDDYVGCDSTRNTYFVYNGTANDGNGSPAGYGNRPPALGVMFQNQELYGFVSFLSDTTGQGSPTSALEYDNYIRGRWKDGSPITVGGDGYGGQQATRFLFSGDPTDTSQWSMASEAGQLPMDVKGLGGVGPFTLPPGGSLCIELGFVFAQTDTGDHLHSVKLLQQRLDQLQAMYDSTMHGCHALNVTQNPPTSIEDPQESMLTIEIGPNPASDFVVVEPFEKGEFDVSVYDVFGKKVYERMGHVAESLKIDMKDWLPGNYLCVVSSGGKTATKKLVKQ